MTATQDICKNRHRGSEESIAAFRRMRPIAARNRVMADIRRAGPQGITAKELAEHWNVGLNTISGRFSELKKDGLIRKIGVRDGCGVYVEVSK